MRQSPLAAGLTPALEQMQLPWKHDPLQIHLLVNFFDVAPSFAYTALGAFLFASCVCSSFLLYTMYKA